MMVHVCVFAAIVLPLLAVPLVLWAGRRLRERTGWLALGFAVVASVAVGILTERAAVLGPILVEWTWVPSLGLNLWFRVDGLSSFFGVVVSFMGVLIAFYARYYLDEHHGHHGRFYAYLLIFMAVMLGTVYSNHLLLLFIFWELTGLASFLLIGFSHETEASRRGARMALLVTSSTGLCMLAGVVLIAQVSGTYDVGQLMREGLDPSDPRSSVAMVLVMIGAFGKSAQFPFHFWLPNAMGAPTPVSAYLHSATMVKLGVFLSARLFPVFGGIELWAPIVTMVAFFTMTLAALLALLSQDLKAILAYSTVSQLGFLIGYYGLGPPGGVEYDYLHILNHVYYKGCLFMIVGIVDHATGTRDVRQLGGLFRRMPVLGFAALLACAAMAGLPGTTGFLSKEMMLKEIFTMTDLHGRLGLFAVVCVVLTSLMKVVFSARIFFGVFMGREPEHVTAHYHATARPMLLPPLLLAVGTLACGLFPVMWERPFNLLAVEGLHSATDVHLVLWHGVTRELVVSMVLVVLGLGLYYAGRKLWWGRVRVPGWLQFDRGFERGLDGLSTFAKRLTRGLRSDEPLDYLPIILGFSVCLVGGSLLGLFGTSAVEGLRWWGGWSEVNPLRVLVALLIALSVMGVLVLRGWATQLIALSVSGFLICFYFVLYRAPDLALTQILIEVVTLFMILILLGRFPRSAERGEIMQRPPGRRSALNACLALGLGGTVTLFIIVVSAAPGGDRLGTFFLENTVPLAEGSNAVNTILVDFRGFDTLGEITVLVVAMLGCLGLLMRYRRSKAEYRAGPMGPPGYGIDDPTGD
jgi:NADH:ubiquinone oxidoreductase subunit 5 (subunit L)/multisubunit Na+/H+ antiporter MnhA subunit/multisubunit Na+/H+ antiporter MnhB subunit